MSVWWVLHYFGPMGKPVLEVIFRESLVMFCIFSNITTIISFNTSNEEKNRSEICLSLLYIFERRVK